MAALGVFIFCPPAMYAVDQGSHEYDAETARLFETGACQPEGATIVCDLTDKATKKKWIESLEKQVEELKIEAGKPTAILKKVCRDKGFTDADCPKILYAMADQESYFGKVMSGDGGRSHGYFHIMDYHNVSKSCSEDLKCSATWTLNRLIAKGFATNRDNAIRLHNGSLANPVTLVYLESVKSKMSLFSQIQ